MRTFEYNWNDRIIVIVRTEQQMEIFTNASRNIGLKAFTKTTGREDLLPAAITDSFKHIHSIVQRFYSTGRMDRESNYQKHFVVHSIRNTTNFI